MKNLILISSVILFGFTSSVQSTVYICLSKDAKKYHFSQSCRGLQKCTHTIKKTTVEDAQNRGYTACLMEK